MRRAVKNPSFRNRTGYHAGLLGGIALLASTALVIGDINTRDDIALRLAEDMQATLAQVIPNKLHENNLLEDTLQLSPVDELPEQEQLTVYRAIKTAEVSAVAYEVIGIGYTGPIVIMMAVDREGTILGVRVISHAETPGLGDKIEIAKDDWILDFNGLSLGNPGVEGWRVKKDGGQFDQFSGATITPRAVVKAVRQGLELFNSHREQLLSYTPPETTTATVSQMERPEKNHGN